jgi:sodium-dependent phosphate cotransporter
VWIFPLQYYFGFLEKIAAFFGNQFASVGGLSLLSPVKAITKPVAHGVLELVGNNGWIGGVIGLLLLFLSLRYLVKLLKMIVVGKIEGWFRRKLFKTAIRSLVLGIVMTILVQSSSITTSFIVPMVGAGILTLEQIFPFTLGANIGTTVTAIMAALVTGRTEAIIVAFAHLLFNVIGIIAIWPFRQVPIHLARKFSEIATQKKFIPFVYILVVFFLIPISFIIIME